MQIGGVDEAERHGRTIASAFRGVNAREDTGGVMQGKSSRYRQAGKILEKRHFT
jgi:hypothetical protein